MLVNSDLRLVSRGRPPNLTKRTLVNSGPRLMSRHPLVEIPDCRAAQNDYESGDKLTFGVGIKQFVFPACIVIIDKKFNLACRSQDILK